VRILEAIGVSLIMPAMPSLLIAFALRRLGLELGPREMIALHGLYGMLGGLAAGYLLGGGRNSAWLWFPLAVLAVCAAGSLTNVWLSAEAKVAVLGGPLRGSLLAVAAGAAAGTVAGAQRAQKESSRSKS
jgi:hypothetical protein